MQAHWNGCSIEKDHLKQYNPKYRPGKPDQKVMTLHCIDFYYIHFLQRVTDDEEQEK